MTIYENLLKPILFNLDPERSHHLALKVGKAASIPIVNALLERYYDFETPRLSQQCFGLHFKNPIGLSAGSDKNCEASEMFAALGFGFLESVSFTYLPQPGNEKPRVFRLPEDDALINRLGFPSIGAEALASRVKTARAHCSSRQILFAVNFAKSKVVDLESSVEDYVASFNLMKNIVDYVTINVSSPNTPGLRQLQGKTYLEDILRSVQNHNERSIPILVKIAPDLTLQEVDQIIEVCLSSRVSAIVATNSTVSRENIKSPLQTQTGGLSGKPLLQKSLPIVRHIFKNAGDKICVIGVGGIFSVEDAISMIQAGASLIEIYTALIYRGPSLVKELKLGLVKHLDRVGAQNIRDIVGCE